MLKITVRFAVQCFQNNAVILEILQKASLTK